MRRRLTASFVLLAVAVLLLAGAVRAWSAVDLIREQETDRLQREAQVVAAVLAEHEDSGRVVGERLLTRVVGPATRLEYVDGSGESSVVAGEGFESGDDDLSAAARSGAGTVRLATGGQKVADLYARELDALLTLLVVVTLLAGLAGWYGARRLAEPFRALAGAAAALGRGRFDLSLPATRIPEARAIGQALERSASQLEGRLLRERAFTEYASHQLRTPLTSLLLELEELTLRPDVSPDVKEAAGRCMQRVDAVNAAAHELVSLSRQGALVEGGQVVLRELTGQITQAWANRLAEARRTVTVESCGELDHGFTPGPVEHILELVLDDVAAGEGPVRLAFEGSPVHLRVTVPAGVAGRGPLPGVESARHLAHAQGGRVTGDLVGADLEILLPRR